MLNSYFNVKFNPENGTVKSIVNPADQYKMNWCIENADWGAVQCVEAFSLSTPAVYKIPLAFFEESDSCCTAIYEDSDLKITVSRFFADNGNYTERYTFKNLRTSDYFLEHGSLGILTPFNDIYTYAEECMTDRCNTHLVRL